MINITEKGTVKYANEQNNNVVAIEFIRKRKQKPSASSMLVRLMVLDYERARQSRRQSVVIQSA